MPNTLGNLRFGPEPTLSIVAARHANESLLPTAIEAVKFDRKPSGSSAKPRHLPQAVYRGLCALSGGEDADELHLLVSVLVVAGMEDHECPGPPRPGPFHDLLHRPVAASVVAAPIAFSGLPSRARLPYIFEARPDIAFGRPPSRWAANDA